MQFTIPAAAFLAFVSGALAQIPGFDTITSPVTGEVLVAGETFTIVWAAAPAKYDEETVTIILLAGDAPKSLIPAEEPVAEGIVNSAGSYDWEVPAELGDKATYGFKIQLDSDPEIFQYSFPFVIEGGDAPISGNSTSTGSATESATEEPTETPTGSDTSVTPPKTTVTRTESETTPTETQDPEVTPTDGNSAARSNAAAGLTLVGGLLLAAFAL